MSKNKYGTCALCKQENVELRQSHIIPKGVFKRAKTVSNSRFRNYYEPKQIYQDGIKIRMLCNDCEEFFSKYERAFGIMASRYEETQKKLDENGLREKIAERYKNNTNKK